ncbi:hypothetical protein ACVXG9_26495 [Escherichia coli]
MALAWLIKTSAMAKMKITNSINAMPSKAAQFCAKFTDGDVYPRHDARQQQTGRYWSRGRIAWLQRHRCGLPGQRHWTDRSANGDTAEAILNSSFDWMRANPLSWRPKTTVFNGVAMLMGDQLTGTAQVFADVRTYWSPEAISV